MSIVFGQLAARRVFRRLFNGCKSVFSRPRMKVLRQQPGAYFLERVEPRILLSADPTLVAMPPPIDFPEEVIFTDVRGSLVAEIIDEQPLILPGADTALEPATDQDLGKDGIGIEFAAAAPSNLLPFGVNAPNDGSEFMIGDVAVTVVLMESDGSIDPNIENWSTSRIERVKSEIVDGLNWWEDTFDLQGSLHDLKFHIDFTYADNPVSTGYEPIAGSGGQASRWYEDFPESVGYESSFRGVVQWNHDQRLRYGADWAFTVFVVDSFRDNDGKFTDDRFAFAQLGGPYLVMTYDNNGWGIDRMGRVLAHEVGHIFRALDEYPEASFSHYNSISGYLGIQNTNAFNGHPNPSSRTDSIMAEASRLNAAWDQHISSTPSLEMLGWRDSDGNGIFDILDVPLTLTGEGSFDTDAAVYRFSGSSSVQTFPIAGRFQNDITLNTVDRLQYRVDGGDWIDGDVYGDHIVSVSQDVDVAASTLGTHTIEFRTIVAETGLSSNIWSDTFDIFVPTVVVSSPSDLTTSESGRDLTFDVVLGAQPTDDVVLTLASSDSTEGVIPNRRLTFTPDNWNVTQVFSVNGVDDVLVDGAVDYQIVAEIASRDPAYREVSVSDLMLTNVDNEVSDFAIGFDFGASDSPLAAGHQQVTSSMQYSPQNGFGWVEGVIHEWLSHSGTAATRDLNFTTDGTFVFDVPAAGRYAVTLTLGRARIWAQDKMGIFLEGAQIDTVDVLTRSSVRREYSVTVLDGQLTVRLQDQGGVDPNVFIQSMEVDWIAGIAIAPSEVITSELGDAATFQVALTNEPSSEVTINLSSELVTEGILDVSTLRFGPGNWSEPQTVTVTGIDDDIPDRDVIYRIVTSAATSEDKTYHNLDSSDVIGVNRDNESPAVVISSQHDLLTSENGSTVAIEVVLTSKPLADVTIDLDSSDPSEGVVDQPTLLFTSGNWNIAQTVTITGVDDAIDDGDQVYSIITSPTASLDRIFSGRSVSDVTLTNTNDDVAGVAVAPNGGLLTWGSGTGLDNIIIEHSGRQDPVSEGWALTGSTTPSPVGVIDPGSDGAHFEAWNLNSNVAGTVAPHFRTNGFSAAQLSELEQGWKLSVAVRVVDGPSIPHGGVSTRLDKDNSLYWMWFGQDDAGNILVNLPQSSSDAHTVTTSGIGGEYHLFELIDAPSDSDGAANGMADLYVDGVLLETGYAGFSNSVSVVRVLWGDISGATSQDGESNWALVTLQGGANLHPIPEPTSLGLFTTETGATASFDVVLNSQPIQEVTIALMSSDSTEGLPDVSALTFTPANWNVSQPVVVTGIDDSEADGDVAYDITAVIIAGGDPHYDSLNFGDIFFVNLDDEPKPTAQIIDASIPNTHSKVASAIDVNFSSNPVSSLFPTAYVRKDQQSSLAPIRLPTWQIVRGFANSGSRNLKDCVLCRFDGPVVDLVTEAPNDSDGMDVRFVRIWSRIGQIVRG